MTQRQMYNKLGNHICFFVGQCSLGFVLIALTSAGICDISFDDDSNILIANFKQHFPKAHQIIDGQSIEEIVNQVICLIETPNKEFSLPLDIRGTPFQKLVWQALREIPVGQRVSYSEIAQRIQIPNAARAVARACAANTIAVVIPCHRVVRSNGELSGYRWGIARKLELLRRESNS